jgi:hypothetical protein
MLASKAFAQSDELTGPDEKFTCAIREQGCMNGYPIVESACTAGPVWTTDGRTL